MKPTNNKILVKTKKVANDTIESSVIGADGKPLNLQLDTSYNPHHHRKICAEVVSVPKSYAKIELVSKYYGNPNPIIKTSDRDFLYTSDFNTDIRIGDTIYFHYLELTDDNLLYTEGEWKFFFINIDQIFCVTRGEDILPVWGHVLVEPFFGKEAVDLDIESEIKGFNKDLKGVVDKKSGLVTELRDKPKYLEGVVCHIGERSFFHNMDVSAGDVVYYTPESEFDNEINGKTYFVMRLWDIIAKVVNDEIIPIGNQVLLQPDKPKTKSEGGIYIPDASVKKKNTGLVLGIGSGCVSELTSQETVMFCEKSPMITPIPDKDVVLIPEEDIYGVVIEQSTEYTT